jgi:hypothetical protein
MPPFRFWLSESQVELLKDILDPSGASAQNPSKPLSFKDLGNLFAKAEANINNVRYSMTRFGIVTLEAIEKYLNEEVPLEVTRQVG